MINLFRFSLRLRLLGRGAGALLAFLAVLPVTTRSEACGGGVATPVTQTASVAVDAQRVYISRLADKTHIVAELRVPAAGGDFGVIIPVPVEPTLDAEPVNVYELNQLEVGTRPWLTASTGPVAPQEPSGGFGCGSGAAAKGPTGGPSGNGSVGDVTFVNIGPITAASLSADSAAALDTWLGENGFAMPADFGPTLESYTGPGRYFIALKRNEAVTQGEAVSLGVAFSLPGDQRGYALKMSRLGAAEELEILVFVAAGAGVAPAAPFTAFTLDDLEQLAWNDDPVLRTLSYRRSIALAVQRRRNQAFLIEGVLPANVWQGFLGPRLSSMTGANTLLTRMTTVMASSQLDTDVAFTDPAPSNVPHTRELGGYASAAAPAGAGLFGLALFGFGRRYQSGQRPRKARSS